MLGDEVPSDQGAKPSRAPGDQNGAIEVQGADRPTGGRGDPRNPWDKQGPVTRRELRFAGGDGRWQDAT
jgi:hypothetical protein